MNILAVMALVLAGCSEHFEFATPTHDLDEGSEESEAEVVLWKNEDKVGDKQYPNFRIPSLMNTPTAVWAFCEARESSSSDNGDIDIVYRTSADMGETWSDPVLLIDDGVNTVGNPCGVCTQTGRIVLVFNWQSNPYSTSSNFSSSLGITWDQVNKHNRRIFCTYSDDNGETWSEPKDLTDDLKEDNWKFCAAGPCHAIQLKNGVKAGRIIVPFDHKDSDNTYSCVAWSDDNGETWTMGRQYLPYGNECCATELSDGRIFLDIRNANSDDHPCRAYSYSYDNGETWSEMAYDETRPEPTPASKGTRGCQGSSINYNTDGTPTSTIMSCNPANKTIRCNLTLYVSYDNSVEWSEKFVVHSGNAGYSDLVVFNDGSVGVMFENGESSYKEKISFVKYTKESLMSKFKNLK